jgi:hypothetical protein
VLDDIQIPSVHELFRFLKRESSVALEDVAVRTAFFRRGHAREHSPDAWMQQGINRHTLLRYALARPPASLAVAEKVAGKGHTAWSGHG